MGGDNGAFFAGLVSSAGDSFATAMAAQKQREFEHGENQDKLAVNYVPAKQANALLSMVAGKPISMFDDGEKVDKAVLDKAMMAMKPPSTGSGSNRFVGQLSAPVKRMLAGVPRALPVDNAATDYYMAYQAASPDSPMKATADQWIASHPSASGIFQKYGGDRNKIAASYNNSAALATNEMAGLMGSARQLTPDQIEQGMSDYYPSLSDSKETAANKFNKTADAFLFAPYRAAQQEMEMDRNGDGTWASPVSERRYNYFKSQLEKVQKGRHLLGTPSSTEPGLSSDPTTQYGTNPWDSKDDGALYGEGNSSSTPAIPKAPKAPKTPGAGGGKTGIFSKPYTGE